MVIKLEVFRLGRNVLFRFTKGYTSIPLPDVCIFNSNLNPACFMHHFPVLTCIFEFMINTAPAALNSVYGTEKCLAYHRYNPGKSALGTRLKINVSKLTWVALWCSGQGVACTCRWTGFDFRRRSFLFLCTVFLFFLFSQFVFYTYFSFGLFTFILTADPLQLCEVFAITNCSNIASCAVYLLSDRFGIKGTALACFASYLRWLDIVFQRQYLPRLSVNYVAISKDLEKLTPQLY